MTKFKLRTMVEDSVGAPYSGAPIFTSIDCTNEILEAAACAAHDSLQHQNLMETAYFTATGEKFFFIQEGALETVWERVKAFIRKIIAAIKKLFTKAQNYFKRVDDTVDRWYKMMLPRWEKARQSRLTVKNEQPDYNVSSRNYKTRMEKFYNGFNLVLYAMSVEAKNTNEVFIVAPKLKVKTIRETIDYVKNAIGKISEEKKQNGNTSKEELNTYAKQLIEDGNFFAKVTSADIEGALVADMIPGARNLSQALEDIKSYFYINPERVEREYNVSQCQDYMDTIGDGVWLHHRLTNLISLLQAEVEKVNKQWDGVRSDIGAYNDIINHIKSGNSGVDVNDNEVKRLINAGAGFISKYANWATRKISTVSRVSTSVCNTLISTISNTQKDAMRLITAYVKKYEAQAAEEA